MKFKDLIKEEREKQGLSKYKLAKKAGVTDVAINYYEQGTRVPSIDNANKLLKALEITLKIGKDGDLSA